MKTFNVRIASLGDVHIGHPRTKASHIIANLYHYLLERTFFKELDILLINGDFWDQLLTLTSDAAIEAEQFIGDLLYLAKKHNVLIRVLEGTPLHDCKHSSKFTALNQIAKIEADVKHFDHLAIEYIESLGIHILYVPDELTTSPDRTWELVQELLTANQLDAVDYVSMHGAFTYQLPVQAQHNCHDPVRWQRIVRRNIFINHVHTSSQYGKIIAPGSFDRLKHGEEEAKGFIYVEAIDDVNNIRFIENQNAKIYRTFDCRGLALDDVYALLAVVADAPPDSNFRITATRDDAIINGYDTLRKMYPQMNWSFKPEKAEVSAISLLPMRYNAPTINRGNFKDALASKLKTMEIDTTDTVYQWIMDYVEKVVANECNA